MKIKTEGAGWLSFISIMMVVSGSLSIIEGITALAKPEYFPGSVLFGNYTLWGIIWSILGPVEIVAGIAILLKVRWARTFCIVIASFGLIWNFMGIGTHPIWSIVVMAIHVLMIYGLVVYGKPDEPSAVELMKEAALIKEERDLK